MVTGIETFREKFSGFENMYTLIGGAACDLIMDDVGLDFRATKDFDIVLIIEALNAEFGRAFWEFIKDGGYQIRKKATVNLNSIGLKICQIYHIQGRSNCSQGVAMSYQLHQKTD